MLSLKEIQESLKDRRLYTVSKETGLAYPTIKRVLDEKANPTYNTMMALSKYLENKVSS